MEVQPVEWEVQPLFYKPLSNDLCRISFDGIKYYTFRKRNVEPAYWIKKFDYIIEYTECEEIRCDGYYDKGKKVIWFFHNRKIYKLYRGIILHQKLERSKQTFLVSDDWKKEKERMSIKEIESYKSSRVDLEDAPKYIRPERIETAFKEATNEKGDVQMCLYMNFFWTEGKKESTVTQKYTPFHQTQLFKRMKLMKIKDVKDWIAPHTWKMEHEVFRGVGYPKYMPVQSEDEEQ